ncbi:MAG: polysaccharide deacetylase [Gilvibacter sp.]
MSVKTGIFSISLDFELHWGIFDNVDIKGKELYFDTTIELIPSILDKFTSNNIECTWATVGMLFNPDVSHIKSNFPEKLPSYTNAKFSTYRFIENELDESNERYYTAVDLIDKIKSAPGQEIGTHTYAHYYALEQGQNKDEFKADIKQSVKLAQGKGIALKSIVFPRNQVNWDYLDVCAETGINIIRVNPDKWAWKSTVKPLLLRKIFRTADCYVPLFNTTVGLNKLNKTNTNHFYLPASRFLKPVSGVKILNKMRLKRVLSEMTKAAKTNSYYHLWWHPHNFGNHPEEAMKELDIIISHYKNLEKEYGMLSLNMQNTYERLKN